MNPSSIMSHVILPDEPARYEFENRTYFVQPVFAQEGKETLGAILLRLMKNELLSA